MKFEEAVNDFSKLIEAISNSNRRKSTAETLLMRAMSFEALGNMEKAKSDYSSALTFTFREEDQDQ